MGRCAWQAHSHHDADTQAPRPLDRVQHQYNDDRPNALWAADFTCVSNWQGLVYVAFLIDVFARRSVGENVSSSARTDFVLESLKQALSARRPAASQRTARLTVCLHSLHRGRAEAGLETAARRVGDAYEIALAETIKGLYKTEVMYRRGPWKHRSEVELALLGRGGLVQPSPTADANWAIFLRPQPKGITLRR